MEGFKQEADKARPPPVTFPGCSACIYLFSRRSRNVSISPPTALPISLSPDPKEKAIHYACQREPETVLAQKEQTVHFCKFAFLVSLLFCGGRQLLPAWESHSLLASVRWLSEATGAQQEGNPVQTHNVPCDQASDSSRVAASASAHRRSQGTLLLMVSESTLCFKEKCWDEEGWGWQWL